ncbi:cupin domain-containing protein [Corynebacterium sp. CCM 8835]|uniref:Cupin domain-containing protein n=1 Tax=Corynebacterium antarcticum TaxID=2800405 RepID=A0A9Q4CCN5_9CORY|nr:MULTISPECIES: cupin domain-containing protein [Corynebacterium]MBV7293448.1 cupin domain-containing protein [Corynebacterium sp. TAE3-ERU16]MCK7641422.1 cupin domain-containing protein [Corynebacterium antarcticum]MCK7660476.1 cupin domain-containing protein [Corynebacterium antarcticum]MCL0244653.1 cupin domain-containing protein [Corynebacterium antarcticum]MCX7491023.1 cupin domain-containing protein [Corynebacterium antarcticum]
MSDLRTDHGPNPYVLDIEKATKDNDNFRDTLWTGKFLQMTVMSIPAGGEIGAEVHDDHDQFLRLEAGEGHVMIGDDADNLDIDQTVEDDWAIFVPAGKWHNVVNEGSEPLKVYSIYAAPDHVRGTIHATKEDADNDPNEQHDD